ncbi:hypothetical protein [Solibacillus sp. FSL W7-1324]|uniref:hypothetical protein n=1 Tax=Solibacillus sp. FSL W7-1324 TaxID=2921701 RepID=UPI0030FA5309
MSSKKRGRPAGKVKTSKIEISIEPEIKDQFMQIAHEKNNYCSVLIREWIIEYIATNNFKKE